MSNYINRPAIIDEAAQAKAKPGKKPGLNIALEILVALAVFIVCIIGEVIIRNLLMIPFAGSITETTTSVMGIPIADFYTIISLFDTIGGTLVASLFMVLIQRRKLRTAGFVKKNALKHYGIGMVLGFATFALSLLICIMTGAVTVTASSGFNVGILLLIFVGFMIQGNSEEVICRGYMLTSVSRRYPTWVGVVFNSVLFAAMHLFNSGITVLAFVNLVLFGVLMSLMFLKTGNIWMVSALHTVWNFVQGNVFGVLVSGGEMGSSIMKTTSDASKAIINGGDFGLEGGLAVTIMLAVTIAILLFIKPCKGVQSEDTAAEATVETATV